MNVQTATNDQLFAAERLAGWKPKEIREAADALEGYRSADDLSEVLANLGILEETVAKMRANADRIEADGPLARAEIERRKAAAPVFKGYVS